MSFFDSLFQQFLQYAHQVPLELFTLVGSFIEEVIAPIPSPLVMTFAGSVAKAQDKAVWYLLVISLFGAIGKTAGAYLLYLISDKTEDIVLSKFGKFVGITHKEVEKIGSYFTGGWRNHAILFVLRSMPVFPSAPISLICGFIKVPLKLFLVWTFIGTIIRDFVYLYLGYISVGSYESISHGFDRAETIGQVLIGMLLVVVVVWLYMKRKKGEDAISTLTSIKHFVKKKLKKDH